MADLQTPPLVSVIVPTHDHGPTLRPAIAAALAQTVADLEVLIVGDGMPPTAAAIARELAATDDRVELFEFEKGERHGEAHRDRVLHEHARGRFILYLSDDDLWHPDHAERMVAALDAADFAAAPYARVHQDGSLDVYPHDLADERTRALMMAEPRHYNHVVLSAGAHTRDAYDRRERGWAPAPTGIWTDLHFWRGFVGDERFACASTGAITVFNFASPGRVGVAPDRRAAELDAWAASRLQPAAGRARLRDELEVALRRGLIVSDLDYQRVYDALVDYQRWTDDLRAQTAAQEERLAALEDLPELRLRSSRIGRAATALRARLR